MSTPPTPEQIVAEFWGIDLAVSHINEMHTDVKIAKAALLAEAEWWLHVLDAEGGWGLEEQINARIAALRGKEAP